MKNWSHSSLALPLVRSPNELEPFFREVGYDLFADISIALGSLLEWSKRSKLDPAILSELAAAWDHVANTAACFRSAAETAGRLYSTPVPDFARGR